MADPAPHAEARSAAGGDADFGSFYVRHFRACCGWLRAMGVPDADLEDLAQEVFLVVERKLGEVEVRDPTGWLYAITWRIASHHRRRTWWRNLLARRESARQEPLIAPPDGPVEALERSDRMRILERVLQRMSALQRTTLLLFEIEGYGGERIAALQGVPLNTVWTRLHKARKSFVELADAERRAAARRSKEKLP